MNPASTDVNFQRFSNFRIRWGLILIEQTLDRDNQPGCAETTLGRLLVQESLLDRIEMIAVAQIFQRPYF